MRAETLVEIATDILEDFEETGIRVILSRLIESLKFKSGSPSEATQKRISELREAARASLAASRFNSYPATELRILKKTRSHHFLGDELRKQIEEAFEGNAITLGIALSRLAEVQAIVDDLHDEASKLISGARYFGVQTDKPPPGTFEMIVSVPGPAIRNELETLGRESLKINRILSVFVEIATGSREPIKVRALSSSDPTFFLIGAPAVAALVAVAFERVVSVYEKVLSIIKMHRDLKSYEIPTDILAALKEHIDKTIEEGLAEAAGQIEKQHFQNIDPMRRGELHFELTHALVAIAKRMDEGYLFDVRGEPPAEGDSAAPPTQSARAIAEALKRVDEVRPKLHQFEAEQEPILRLSEGDEATRQ